MTFIIVMASSSDISINPSQANAIAKGKRRVKGKTLDLNTFLGEDQDAPSGFAVVNTRRIDWGDAMENEELDDKYTLDFKKEEKLVLPTAPKAARGLDIDINKIPSRPPFTAFLGNLPYDVTEDDIVNFFHQLEVTNVRLPREGGDKGRLRGFGYAEFHDRHSLIQALSLNNETLKNRSIKVSLAGEHDTDRKDDRNDRTTGDWRAATRDQPYFRDDRQRNGLYGSQYARGYPDRGRANNERELNYGRDRYDKNEKSYERFDRNDQGYGSDKDWDRAYNADREQRYKRNGNRNFEFADRGLDRGGRNNRRDFGGNFKDNYERRKDDYVRERDSRYRESRERDYPYRDSCDSGGYESREERESSEKDYPKERRKLQLKPRTKPLETSNVPFEPLSNSAIFGGARPVDTAAREREIEERLVKEREESGLRDQKERRDDPKSRRFSTSSGISTRSRRSSESGPSTSYRDSFSEDDSIPQGKPPAPRQHFPENRHYNTLPRVRQRRSSASSTGSDRENQTNSRNSRPPIGRRKGDNPDYNYNRKNNVSQERLQQCNNEYRCTDQLTGSNRNSRNGHFHHDSSRERLFRISTYEEPKPPVYTSANKFSHLMNDAEEVDRGSASD